jgi:hypothetical protein
MSHLEDSQYLQSQQSQKDGMVITLKHSKSPPMQADFTAYRGDKIVHCLFTGDKLEGRAIIPADLPQSVFVYRETYVLPGMLGIEEMLANCPIPCIIVSSLRAMALRQAVAQHLQDAARQYTHDVLVSAAEME